MKKKILYIFITILSIVIVVLLSFFSNLPLNNKDTFTVKNPEKFQNVKHVCIVWNNKIDDKTNQGFGDRIRGIMYIYRFFKSINKQIEIVVDASEDTCSEILKNVHSRFSDKIKDIKEYINYIYGSDDIEKEIEQLNDVKIHEDTIFIFSNCLIRENNLTEDEKEFAKYICEPKENIKSEIQNKIQKLPKDFTIKHFRFNDDVFQKDVDINDATFKKYFDLLKEDYLETDILITNSNNFTKYVIEHLKMKFIDCDNNICSVGHIGNSNDFTKVKNSFIEFYIISSSKKIMTYTCYPWPSNFVAWTSKIYDIPMESKENL